MKLQYKFNLGLIALFCILSIGMAIMSVQWVNNNTIREAKNRVRLYIRSAWEIYYDKIARIQSLLIILVQEEWIRDLLKDQENKSLSGLVKEKLENIRKEYDMDILTLMDSQGRVILRTNSSDNRGDSLSEDLMVKHVILTEKSSVGTVIFESERLEVEGGGLLERCSEFGEPRGMLIGSAEPIIIDGNLIGIIQMGNLVNGATEKVDRIRDGVFENKQYKGIPVGTATFFMGDMRISTNVMDEKGGRAVGTRVSDEVAEHVLNKGLSWTGRAWVVNAWYLSQYDPIKDPDGNIIGMIYVGELEQKYLDMRTHAVLSYLSVIMLSMVVAFILLLMITRGILNPINQLSEATQRLSDGDLSYRVDVRTKDEVGSLSLSFNRMADQLQKQRQEIENRQKALEEINEEIKAINKNYMDMLGFVTHELKNPLSSAIMSLYTVKDEYVGSLNASQKKGLESVANSLDYFNDMIRNYLDLSRLEKGEITVNTSKVILCPEVINPVFEGLEHEIRGKNMQWKNLIPPDIELNTDRDLLRIVYDNLLTNAIKYGIENGSIVLDAREDTHHITLSVFNEGQGISKDKMSMLFKKFSRVDSPEYAGKKGTGLGLYICREIIEKQNGKIWAESEVGKWTRFSFKLPT